MTLKQGLSNHVDVGSECVGCHGCATVCPQSCIDMTADAMGFSYPLIEQSRCTECGSCRRVCPVIEREVVERMPDSYACRAVDKDVRMNSSSGGVFTLLAEKVIDGSGVVFGAAFDEDFGVAHRRVEIREDLALLRGSKYVQSVVGGAYGEVGALLKDGRHVLFAGTPCQVAGLKSYLARPFDNLLSLDFICHGVPSPAVWRQYVSFQERRHAARLCAASFRDKTEGWKQFSILLEFENGDEYRETFDRDPYLRAFLQDICLRPTCYACKFKGLSRDSDITLADFWGIQDVLPAMDDDSGTSLIMVHSERGRIALDELRDRMDCEGVATSAAIKYNSAAVQSAIRHPNHDLFYADLGMAPFDKLVGMYCAVPFARRIRTLAGRAVRRVARVLAR